jgi:DNA-binding transcriptional MerR regulator
MKKIMNIDQLADEANDFLNKNQVSGQDGRYSTEVSPRRIRDYVSKGLLDKPFKEGKNIFFNENHLEKLIALRQFQSDGLSDQYLHKLIKSKSEESALDNESINSTTSGYITTHYSDTSSFNASGSINETQALSNVSSNIAHLDTSFVPPKEKSASFSEDDLGLQQKAQMALSKLSGSSLHSSASVQSFYSRQPEKRNDLNALNYPVNKVWQEYPLDEDGKVFLRFEQGSKIKNKEKMLESIMNLLNILGD